MIDLDETAGLAPTSYYDRTFAIDAAKILPGEYFVTRRDMAVVTVLGSCVAACLRDRISGWGGMNHFMLPGIDGGGPVSVSARYGVHAMEILVNRLLKFGAQRNKLEAKVFGGGQRCADQVITFIQAYGNDAGLARVAELVERGLLDRAHLGGHEHIVVGGEAAVLAGERQHHVDLLVVLQREHVDDRAAA